jgi:hypothetical protein
VSAKLNSGVTNRQHNLGVTSQIYASTTTLSIKFTTSNFVLAQLLPGSTGLLLPISLCQVLSPAQQKENKERIFFRRAQSEQALVQGRGKATRSRNDLGRGPPRFFNNVCDCNIQPQDWSKQRAKATCCQ